MTARPEGLIQVRKSGRESGSAPGVERAAYDSLPRLSACEQEGEPRERRHQHPGDAERRAVPERIHVLSRQISGVAHGDRPRGYSLRCPLESNKPGTQAFVGSHRRRRPAAPGGAPCDGGAGSQGPRRYVLGIGAEGRTGPHRVPRWNVPRAGAADHRPRRRSRFPAMYGVSAYTGQPTFRSCNRRTSSWSST